MTLSQILLTIRARYSILLAAVLLTAGTAIVVSLLMPKVYRATTTLVLNFKGMDPVTGKSMPGNLMPGYLATQLDIISSKALVMRVIDRLKLADDEQIKAMHLADTKGKISLHDWLAEGLAMNLDVTPSRQSSVIDISFRDGDPQTAAMVADAFAEEYRALAVQLNAEPQQRLSVYFREQAALLRERLQAAHDRLSVYQKETGLVSVDGREDADMARLRELSSQLVAVQGQLMDARSRERDARNANPNAPDIVANPLIQTLRAQLAQAEARLSQVATRFMPDHPEYERAAAEVRQVKATLDGNIRGTAASVGHSARILAEREKVLSTALDEQREKLLQANQARAELAVLSREVESAQKAYDDLMQRFNQVNLDGQANQSDVAVLNPAFIPTIHAYPRIALNTAVGLLLGTVLGLCLVFLIEFMDRRVRSARDLATVLRAPVLGVITPDALPRHRVPLLGRSQRHQLLSS